MNRVRWYQKWILENGHNNGNNILHFPIPCRGSGRNEPPSARFDSDCVSDFAALPALVPQPTAREPPPGRAGGRMAITNIVSEHRPPREGWAPRSKRNNDPCLMAGERRKEAPANGEDSQQVPWREQKVNAQGSGK